MTESVSILIALTAGVLSFLSPCVLPLVPSYLVFVTGMSLEDLQGGVNRRATMTHAILFVVGFSLIFILLGASASFLGQFFRAYEGWIARIGGVIIILLGLHLTGVFKLMPLMQEKRVHLADKPAGYLGTLGVGMAFGAGWTPCVGPILASILFLAGSSGRILQGSLLLLFYSLGLGLPFLLAGLFFAQFLKQRDRLKRHFEALRIAGGVFLVFIGLLILLGRLQRFNVFLFRASTALQGWQQANPGQVRLFFAAIFLVPAVFLILSIVRRTRTAGRWKILPGRWAFAAAFVALSALTFVGVVEPTGFFTFWFTFQGI